MSGERLQDHWSSGMFIIYLKNKIGYGLTSQSTFFSNVRS